MVSPGQVAPKPVTGAGQALPQAGTPHITVSSDYISGLLDTIEQYYHTAVNDQFREHDYSEVRLDPHSAATDQPFEPTVLSFFPELPSGEEAEGVCLSAGGIEVCATNMDDLLGGLETLCAGAFPEDPELVGQIQELRTEHSVLAGAGGQRNV